MPWAWSQPVKKASWIASAFGRRGAFGPATVGPVPGVQVAVKLPLSMPTTNMSPRVQEEVGGTSTPDLAALLAGLVADGFRVHLEPRLEKREAACFELPAERVRDELGCPLEHAAPHGRVTSERVHQGPHGVDRAHPPNGVDEAPLPRAVRSVVEGAQVGWHLHAVQHALQIIARTKPKVGPALLRQIGDEAEPGT